MSTVRRHNTQVNKNPIAAAKWLLEQKLWPVPIRPRSKKPLFDDWTNHHVRRDEIVQLFSSDNNIGILLGTDPRPVVDIDLDCQAAIDCAKLIKGPPTGRIFGRKGSPSSHYLFEVEGEAKTVQLKDGDEKIIEFRGTGAQTVIPPSIHAGTGELIRWEKQGEFGKVKVQDLLLWFNKIYAAALLARHWPEAGARHEPTLALAGYLAVCGWKGPDIMELVTAAARSANDPKIDDRQTEIRSTCEKVVGGDRNVLQKNRLIKSFGKKVVSSITEALELVRIPDSSEVNQTDYGNLLYVAEKCGDRLAYCAEVNKWYVAAANARWSVDRTNHIHQIVRNAMRQKWDEVSKTPGNKEAVRHAHRSLELPLQNRCVAGLQSWQDIAVRVGDSDSDPFMLGVDNGVLNLRTKSLEPLSLGLRVAKCADVSFDPRADCKRFMKYLERVQPNEDVRQFLQRLAGACLTGYQPEQSFIFFYGEGGNGKSVLLSVLQRILGRDYAFPAMKHLFFVPDRRSGEQAARPNDVADLVGMRLIVGNERNKEGSRWNTEFIKAFTGGELQHGRQLYQPGAAVKPVGKIIVSANNKPELDEFDEAIRRRFILVPWDVVLSDDEKVTPLERYLDILLKEKPGILNWALLGLENLIDRKWRLDPPEVVKKQTDEYIRSEDLVRKSSRNALVETSKAEVMTQELYTRYLMFGVVGET